MKFRSVLAAAALLASALFIGGTATAQQVTVVDDDCTYSEAIAGVCELDRAIFVVDQLPGDGLGDWFTTYGGLDVGCQNFGFDQVLCVLVEFSRGNGVSCVKYPTFTHCEADIVPDPADQIIVVVPPGEDCTIQPNGNITCVPGSVPASVPVPTTPSAPVPAFTG